MDPAWAEWVVRQGSGCILVQAPNPEGAVETAARRIGPIGGWRVGSDIAYDVFAHKEYPEQAPPGDYTPGSGIEFLV